MIRGHLRPLNRCAEWEIPLVCPIQPRLLIEAKSATLLTTKRGGGAIEIVSEFSEISEFREIREGGEFSEFRVALNSLNSLNPLINGIKNNDNETTDIDAMYVCCRLYGDGLWRKCEE